MDFIFIGIITKKNKQMKVINNEKYSKKRFEDYKTRVVFEFKTENDLINVEVYTTETDLEKIYDDISSIASPKVKDTFIHYYSTKEDDEKAKELVDSIVLF